MKNKLQGSNGKPYRILFEFMYIKIFELVYIKHRFSKHKKKITFSFMFLPEAYNIDIDIFYHALQ